MKLIKISDDHYVVVDDLEIKEGDWYYSNYTFHQMQSEMLAYQFVGEKITHSTNIDWDEDYYIPLSEVKELLGVVDVEKMAEEALISHPDFKAEGYSDYQNGRFNGIVEGYNKACEKYRFTEEDIINWTMSMIAQYVHGNTNIWNRDLLRESLPKPKTEWDVEFEDGKLKLK